MGRCHYTIAHEVAHIVLDEPKLGNRSEPTQHVFRSADHESNKGASEKSADMFAARLLMPADLVYAKWELIVPRTGTVDEPANRLEATRLARVFALSRKAMGYRLADLGLISYKDRPPVTW